MKIDRRELLYLTITIAIAITITITIATTQLALADTHADEPRVLLSWEEQEERV